MITGRPYVLGIAGASGSGKSTLTEQLLEHFTPENCLVVCTDRYYKKQTHLTMEERVKTNYDHPGSLEFSLLAEQLAALLRGEEVDLPHYDFKAHDRSSETTRVKPKPYILVEGILTLHSPEIAKYLELKIFVKTEMFLCYQRREARDIKERGRTKEQVREQFHETVWPMWYEFVKGCKKNCDIQLNNIAADPDFDMEPVIQAIREKLQPPVHHSSAHLGDPGLLKLHSLFQRQKLYLTSKTEEKKAHKDQQMLIMEGGSDFGLSNKMNLLASSS